MEALRTVERQVDNWNDDRLDELSRRVDAGFAKVDKEMKEGFARVDREMKEGFARVDQEVKGGFSEIKGELHRINDRIDRIMYGFFAMGAGTVGALLIAALRLT